MKQQHGAPRRSARPGAVVLTTLALLGSLLPGNPASASPPAAAAERPAGTVAGAAPSAGAVVGHNTTGAVGRGGAGTVADRAGSPVAVALAGISPTVARPGDDVKVKATITNTTGKPLEGLKAKLAINAVALTQRASLAAWESLPLTERVASAGPGAKDLGRLAAGQSRTVDLTFPTATYTLQGWGPRELSLEVTGSQGRVGVLRTFLMYDDGVASAGRKSMRLTIAAPVTAGIVDPADIEGAQLQLAQEAADEGRLDQLLEVARSGKVSLAVDPNVVGLARAADSEDLRAWGESFLTATHRTSTYALPAWDPDLGALAHADVSQGRINGILNTPAVGKWTVPPSWNEGLAWPANGATDRVTVAAATYADRPFVILSQGTLAPTSPDVATSRADLELERGLARTAVADAVLSAAFVQGTDVTRATSVGVAVAESAPGQTDGAEPIGAVVPSATGAAAAQRLLAETAAVVAQATSSDTHALIATDRAWYPDADAVGTILGTLGNAPWVEIAPLKRLLGSGPHTVGRKPLPQEQPTERELDDSQVDRIDESRTRIIDFSSIAADPEELRRNSLMRLVAPLSVGYRRDPDQRQAAVDAGVQYAQEVREAVEVIPREGVNLISDRGDLPIRVRNNLDTDITVTVVLKPDNPRLTVTRQVTGTIPSFKEMNLSIPVEAIGSGDVTVTSQLFAPSGVQLGSESSFEVRVRAGWEEVGTWIVAGLVGLLFAVGIWRTVRRGRSPNRATVEDVAAATGEFAVTEPPADVAAASGTTTDAPHRTH
ncbi:DUF6049 family protein [Myceligenerans crystallogenes]|uniref:DUF6049 family protein n=1 Tax=Myceligenerans crystallogenes TaxID=316335 RepID=A0ABN2ND25_9MICO